MPISHTPSLAQTTKIVRLQGVWFSSLALCNNRWIARLFTVASHKLPVSKLLYYLWNRKITKKYLSWLLPAGEPLPEKLFVQICMGAKIAPAAIFGVLFLQLFVSQYTVTLFCCAPEQVFPAPRHLQLNCEVSANVWRNEGGKRKSHGCMLQRSAMNKKCLKPFCFTMTMTNEMLPVLY